jgi:hypothetical protein
VYLLDDALANVLVRQRPVLTAVPLSTDILKHCLTRACRELRPGHQGRVGEVLDVPSNSRGFDLDDGALCQEHRGRDLDFDAGRICLSRGQDHREDVPLVEPPPHVFQLAPDRAHPSFSKYQDIGKKWTSKTWGTDFLT